MASRVRNFRELQEQSELLLEKLGMLSPVQRAQFDERFVMSWIFHDFALEGTVLQIAEIKAATDPEIISNASLIPAYNHIAAMRDGIDFIMESRGKRLMLNLEWLKKIHQILLPADIVDDFVRHLTQAELAERWQGQSDPQDVFPRPRRSRQDQLPHAQADRLVSDRRMQACSSDRACV